MPTPKRLRNKSIKEVLSNPDLRRIFLHNINPRINCSVISNFSTDTPDKLIWEGDPSGMVTTANFLKSAAPSAPAIKKF